MTEGSNRYRVAWRYYKSGETGHGDWLTHTVATAWVEEMNRKYGGIISHWVEARQDIDEGEEK